MPLTIEKSALVSRTIRTSVSQSGIRKLDFNSSYVSSSAGALERVWNFGKSLVGFITQLPGWLYKAGVTITNIFGWLTNAAIGISQFDWNATDETLYGAIEQRNVALAGTWGGVVGTTLGQLAPIAIGAGIGLLIPVVGGPGLAAAVVLKAAPEALEEIWGSLRNALFATAAVTVQNLVTWSYINIRKLIKSLPQNALKTLVGERNAEWIKNVWGAKGSPRFTLADTLEESVESIQNPYFRAFTEELVDEFFDSFIESGFIVAQSMDQAIAEAKAAQAQARGPDRTVLIQPDKRAPALAFAVTGAEEDVKQTIQNTITTHRQIAAKDVGQIVGMPAEDWYRGKPQRRKMTIVFKEIERPPYYRRGGGIKSATYSIPDPKPTLSWERIKRAAKPYNWGKFRCTANLDNGRQMAVYAATGAEAEEKLRDLLELSTAGIVTLSVTEEKDRNPKLRKDTTRLYPATGTVLVRRPSLDTVGRTDLDGKTWDEEHIRFDLWPDQEPDEFQFVQFGADDAN